MLVRNILLPLRRWRTRMQQRSVFAGLSKHALQDIGLSRLELDCALEGCPVSRGSRDPLD